jgi:trigger factor
MYIKKINNNFVQFHFKINKEEFESYIEIAFNKIKNNIEIKGFRKGFITRNIFKKKIGDKNLYKNALDICYKKKIEEIFKNNKDFVFINEPKLISLNIEKLEQKNFFDLILEFSIMHRITLCNYKNIEIEINYEQNLTIEEKEIEKNIDLLLQKNIFSNFKNKKIPLEKGDLAIINLKSFNINNQKEYENKNIFGNYSLEIGKNQFISGFDEQLLGMKINEKKTFSLFLPLKNENKENISQEIRFEVLLKNIKVKRENYLNDEFIKSIKIPNIFTFQELKNEVKKELENHKEKYVKQIKKKKILDFIIKNSNIEIEDKLIVDEIKNLKTEFVTKLKEKKIDFIKYLESNKISKEEWENEIKNETIKKIKKIFILNTIFLNEKMEISKEEIYLNYKKIMLQNNISLNELEKNFFLIEEIKKNIIMQKAMIFLLKNNVFVFKNKEDNEIKK